MFLTIDPGNDTGWALWLDGGLVTCGLNAPPRAVSHVWIEDQAIIPRVTRRPQDILTLAQNAGRWAGRYEAFGSHVQFIAPNVWKGGPVPKNISHPRIWAALRDAERSIVDEACRGMAPSKRHNVLDAVGIGLWVAKRSAR